MANTRITEKIEYKTDVITCYDGHEQRIKTRQIPRYSVSYDYDAMNAYQAQWLRGMSRMRQTDLWYIPMWHKPVYLREDFIAHGKALYIDNEYMYNLHECEWIEIFVMDDFEQSGINIVRAVHSYSDGIITLKKKIDRNLNMKNTFIYPLFQMSTQSGENMRYIYSNGNNMTLNFEKILKESKVQIPYKYREEYDTDIKGYNSFGLPETYNGKEVFLNRPKWCEDDDHSLTVERNIEKMDNETGSFVYDLKNTYSYDYHSTILLLNGQKMINNLKKFFLRMQGKFKSFYMPSWVNDFQVDRDIVRGNNFIYTRFNNIYKYYIGNGRKKAIVIFTKDMHSYIYEISAYSYELIGDKQYGKLILSSPITDSIDKNMVLMVSYFNLVRLDDDSLKIDYESNIVATTTLVTKEVDDNI